MIDTIPLTRKQQEIQRKTKEIQAVALKLFAAKGYAGTTLEGIASELGYTKQALYYYYRSKEDLVLSLVRTTLEGSLEKMHLLLAASDHPLDNLRDLIGFTLRDHLNGQGFFHIFHHMDGLMDQILNPQEHPDLQELRNRFSAQVMDILDRGISQGVFRQDDPRILGGVILAMVSGVIQLAASPMLDLTDPETLTKTVSEIILKGVTP